MGVINISLNIMSEGTGRMGMHSEHMDAVWRCGCPLCGGKGRKGVGRGQTGVAGAGGGDAHMLPDRRLLDAPAVDTAVTGYCVPIWLLHVTAELFLIRTAFLAMIRLSLGIDRFLRDILHTHLCLLLASHSGWHA
jgi:hypothetical protein